MVKNMDSADNTMTSRAKISYLGTLGRAYPYKQEPQEGTRRNSNSESHLHEKIKVLNVCFRKHEAFKHLFICGKSFTIPSALALCSLNPPLENLSYKLIWGKSFAFRYDIQA
jgi:hypothetical protein